MTPKPPLDGNGPWKIVPHCPSTRHNTIAAARGMHSAKRIKCVCPRAISLKRDDARRRADAVLESAPHWLLAGPWRISPFCKAAGHNTLLWANRAAAKDSAPCTCQRALELLEEHHAKRRGERYVLTSPRRFVYLPPVVLPEKPDWEKGLCWKSVAVADLGFDDAMSSEGIGNRQKAKDLCSRCRIKEECGAWAAAVEGDRPGSLGGVYGGKDVFDRQGYELQKVAGR